MADKVVEIILEERLFYYKHMPFQIMNLTKEEFDLRFKETLELIVTQMAENPEVQVDKFYHMTYFMKNLAFFSPVIFDLLQKQKS